MTVSTTTTKVIYNGNGSTTNWPITFPYGLSQNNLAVYITDTAGVITKLLSSQYTYDEPNLRIVYPKVEIPALPSLPTGYKLTIAREIAPLQEVDLVNQGPFTAQGIENSFDKNVMMIQELIEKVTRCIQYPIDEIPSSTETSGFLDTITTLKNDAQAAATSATSSAGSALSSALNASTDAITASTAAAAASLSETNAAASALAAQNPTNVNQDSTHRFVTDTQIAEWDFEKTKIDTYANLVTWASTASNALRAFATDLKLYYIVIDNVLNEVSFMKTINGTITNAQVSVGTSAVRATVSGSAPNANRKRLKIKPSKNNAGAIFYGGSSVTTATGMEIIGPDGIVLDWDASDYYLISDTTSQIVEVMEVV